MGTCQKCHPGATRRFAGYLTHATHHDPEKYPFLFWTFNKTWRSLTDIARYKNSERTDDLIRNWLRNRNRLEFLGIWEQLNNPGFNPVEFDGIRMQAGLNSFTLTPKQWIEATGAIGINSKAGRYGGTFAHRDIAFEFASWVSVEFKLYLIKEFQRLKEEENRRLSLASNLNRT